MYSMVAPRCDNMLVVLSIFVNGEFSFSNIIVLSFSFNEITSNKSGNYITN